MPERIAEAWDRLRTWMLEDEADSWDPWVEWYERVRDGRPSFGEAFDLAVASLTAQQWNEEPPPPPSTAASPPSSPSTHPSDRSSRRRSMRKACRSRHPALRYFGLINQA